MGLSAAVLIYDAECPVCRGAIEWVRRNAPSPGAAFLSRVLYRWIASRRN